MSTAQESQAAEMAQASAQLGSGNGSAASSRPTPAYASPVQLTSLAQPASPVQSSNTANTTNTAQAVQRSKHPQHPASPKRIRIFTAAHTPATFPDCASIMPIQVGAELAECQGRPLFEETLHDNDGEHISELNPMYSELTAMYWAWKNADADYYGFCQYRRYLDFAGTPQPAHTTPQTAHTIPQTAHTIPQPAHTIPQQPSHAEDDRGEVEADYIDAQSIAEFGLDDGTIALAVEGWDVVTGPLVDVRRLNGFMTLKEQWAADPHLHLRDLRHMYDVLCARHPEYRADADAVLDGHALLTNNMFVMRRSLFRAYCAWLFPLLEEFTDAWDHAHADVETLRTPGHLAERLLTIWLAHLARVGVAADESGEPVPADAVSPSAITAPSCDAPLSSDSATHSDSTLPSAASGDASRSSDSASSDFAISDFDAGSGAAELLSSSASLSSDSATHSDSATSDGSPTIATPTPTPPAPTPTTDTIFTAATTATTARPLKLRRLQCVRFAHPEPFLPLEPLDTNPRFTVPVIFAADDDYVPVLATAVTSMLRNASPDRHYDVIVLERDITQENRRTLAAFLEQFPNATIRFYDVGRAIAGYRLPEGDDAGALSISNAFSSNGAAPGTSHTSPNRTTSPNRRTSPAPISPERLAADHRLAAETCYRFVIQDALPFYSKVLYLDCDVVVTGDIAELYDMDLDGNAVGAVPDVDFLGNLNMKDGRTAAYASGPDSRLHMRDPFGYFQTGVLLMDLERMRDLHTVDEWLRLARSPRFLHHDQDVLNMECEGDVRYLPFEWNVLHNCGDRMHGVFDFAPVEAFLGYVESRKAPKIVHYAGFDKPWTNPWCDFGPLYWSYARTTPFSLQVMAMLADVDKPKPATFHERALAEDHPMRKYVDKVAPLGSRQREVIKVIARKVQGKQ